jgi:hypothetical protein
MYEIGQRVVGSGTGNHGEIVHIESEEVWAGLIWVLVDGEAEPDGYGNAPGNLLPEDGPLIRCCWCDWLHGSVNAVRECFGEMEEARYWADAARRNPHL